MNGNPFYVQPVDISPGLRGLAGSFERMGNRRRAEEAERKAEEKTKVIREKLLTAYRSGDPNQIAEVVAEYPEFAKAASIAYGLKTENDRAEYAGALRAALNDPDKMDEIAKNQMPRGAAVDPKRLIEIYKNDPDKAKLILEQELAIFGGEEWKAYRESTSPSKGLTSTQKDYNLAVEQGFKGTFIDYKKAVSGDIDKNDLEMLKLRTQILEINDRIATREAERKAKEAEAKETETLKEKKTKHLISGIDSVLGEIDKAVDQVKASPSATGITGAATSIVPGSPSYNLRRRVETIKANVGFDKLQAMRDASPTGGALGQVSERELNFLQSTITALDPNMGDKELIEGLRKVEKHYNNWKRTLTGEMPGIREQVKKGLGYFGPLQRPDGKVSTELSIGVNIDGQEMEIPSLVPTLTQDEVNYLLSGKEPTKEIVDKAVDHAKRRLNEGKSPFADEVDYLKTIAEKDWQ